MISEGSCDTKDWSNDAKNSNIGSLKIHASKLISAKLKKRTYTNEEH